MRAYELALSESAAMTLAEADRTEQRRLGAILDQLKADPFRHGDLQEQDAWGRVHEILLVGKAKVMEQILPASVVFARRF